MTNDSQGRRLQAVSETSSAFRIDTEVAPAYLGDMLDFIHQYYLLPHPERFIDVKRDKVDHDRSISFKAIDPHLRGYVAVELVGSRPIEVKMAPSDTAVPVELINRLREDLIITVQLFEERVRKTTLYFAWVEGERVVPETLPSARRRTVEKVFTGNLLYLYIVMTALSILLFGLLGYYAPVAIIGVQFITLLFTDKITLRLGKWRIDLENRYVHLLQYTLPTEEYQALQSRYGPDTLLRMKAEIYESTLALGKEPSCELGAKVFSKYGIACDPQRMSVKKIDVYGLVERAASRFSLPTPKIVISNSMLPNAAATGPSPSRGAVLITTGLLVQLEEDEIFSVIGHEMGHLKGRDPLILFAITASEYLLRLYVFLPLFLVSPFLYLMVAMGVVYFIAKFFEARADLESAMVIGQPEVLADALTKIGFRRLQFERVPGYRIQDWLSWDPHPPVYFRVGRLERLRAPVEVRHPLIQSAKDVINGFKAAL
jgi:heat shock protein HtpX